MNHRYRLIAALAIALVAPSLDAQVAADTSARRFRVDAASLRPGQFFYELSVEQEGRTTPIGTRTVAVSEINYAGTPAWLLLDTHTTGRVTSSDSLITTRADLRPLHWGSTLGGARLSVEFVGDSIVGATSGPPGRRTVMGAVPPGTLATAAMMETVLRLAPLQQYWMDSATTLSVTLHGQEVMPTQLSVIGEDRVHVPAGTFECWVVVARAGQSRGMYWVTKRDPIVVRSTQTIGGVTGDQVVSALVRVNR